MLHLHFAVSPLSSPILGVSLSSLHLSPALRQPPLLSRTPPTCRPPLALSALPSLSRFSASSRGAAAGPPVPPAPPKHEVEAMRPCVPQSPARRRRGRGPACSSPPGAAATGSRTCLPQSPTWRRRGRGPASVPPPIPGAAAASSRTCFPESPARESSDGAAASSTAD
jgi:hypothetical protein